MLFKSVGLISAILAIVGYAIGIYEALWAIPVAFLVIGLVLLLVWSASCFISTRFVDFEKDYDEHSGFYRFFTNCIIDTVIQFLRIKVHISGKEILPEEKFLFVGNHRGALDPLITMGVLRKYRMGFVAKKELFKIPIISRLMHRCYCLNLHREDVKKGAMTILRAGKLVKEGRASIGIYPEGGRNTGEEMLPFKHGALKIAKKADCPIVVASITNTENIMKNAPFKRTHVYLDFIGVIDKDVVSENNTVQLSNMAREMLEKHLAEKKS